MLVCKDKRKNKPGDCAGSMGGAEGAWMRIFVETGMGTSATGCGTSGRRMGTDSSEGLNSTSEIFKRHVCTSVSMFGCLEIKKNDGKDIWTQSQITRSKEKKKKRNSPTLTT
jgi:hypothetical protein